MVVTGVSYITCTEYSCVFRIKSWPRDQPWVLRAVWKRPKGGRWAVIGKCSRAGSPRHRRPSPHALCRMILHEITGCWRLFTSTTTTTNNMNDKQTTTNCRAAASRTGKAPIWARNMAKCFPHFWPGLPQAKQSKPLPRSEGEGSDVITI